MRMTLGIVLSVSGIGLIVYDLVSTMTMCPVMSEVCSVATATDIFLAGFVTLLLLIVLHRT